MVIGKNEQEVRRFRYALRHGRSSRQSCHYGASCDSHGRSYLIRWTACRPYAV